jgi:hypothetical protein
MLNADKQTIHERKAVPNHSAPARATDIRPTFGPDDWSCTRRMGGRLIESLFELQYNWCRGICSKPIYKENIAIHNKVIMDIWVHRLARPGYQMLSNHLVMGDCTLSLGFGFEIVGRHWSTVPFRPTVQSWASVNHEKFVTSVRVETCILQKFWHSMGTIACIPRQIFICTTNACLTEWPSWSAPLCWDFRRRYYYLLGDWPLSTPKSITHSTMDGLASNFVWR